MGGTQSSMGVTREALLKSSQPMRLIADAALRVMFERITPKDLLDLGNPSTCNKYVVVIGGAFDQYFRSIDVMPVLKGKPATIYFQRADILTGTAAGMPEAYKKQRQEICVLLGYFFKRFFQIYAALALSVFDSENIRQASGVFGLLGGPGAKPGQSAYGVPQLVGRVFDPRAGVTVRGGGGPAELQGSSLSFLAPYVSDAPTELILKQRYATVTGPRLTGYAFTKYADMYLIRASSGFFIGLKSEFADSLYFMVRISSRGSTTSDTRTVEFSDVYKDGEKISVSGFSNVNLRIAYKDTKNGSERWKVVEPASLENVGLARGLHTVAKHLQDRTVPGAPIPPLRTSDVEKKRERADNDYYRGERRIERGYYKSEQGLNKAPADLAGIFSALERTRPVAHCVARSLQLLQLDALGPASARVGQSFICNAKFLVPESAADSIPRPGEKLSKSPGLSSLEALYEVYQNGKVGLPEGSGEYLQFLRTMESLFQGSGAIGAKSLASITSKRDKDVCDRILPAQIKDRQGTPIPLAGPALEAARKRVKELWGIHMAHVKAVDALFATMFSISGGNQIGVNPTIIAAGLPGLDALAAKSRDILMKYYASCEGTYRAGVDDILRTIPSVQAGPIPAPVGRLGQPVQAVPGVQPQEK